MVRAKGSPVNSSAPVTGVVMIRHPFPVLRLAAGDNAIGLVLACARIRPPPRSTHASPLVGMRYTIAAATSSSTPVPAPAEPSKRTTTGPSPSPASAKSSESKPQPSTNRKPWPGKPDPCPIRARAHQLVVSKPEEHHAASSTLTTRRFPSASSASLIRGSLVGCLGLSIRRISFSSQASFRAN